MQVLNEELVFHRDVPESDRRAFARGSARRILLPPGSSLFKLSGAAILPRQLHTAISPWWISTKPVDAGDLGVELMIRDAQQQGESFETYIRRRFAVKLEWNSMVSHSAVFTRIVRITLAAPVFAFYGRSQRMTDDRAPLAAPLQAGRSARLAGGGGQIWLPNLTSKHFVHVTFQLLPR
ncbi:MAG: hypothetical protein IT454_10680 [Planctomycetes bacterium]|nr:hypothetical protein [Planctomycetota bacterium]